MKGLIPLALIAISSAVSGQSPVQVNTVHTFDASPRERRDMITELQNGLPAGTKIERCDVVMSYIEDLAAGKDWSFGAACRVHEGQKRRMLIMCADWMVGKFAAEPGTGDREELRKFIGKRCPPGG